MIPLMAAGASFTKNRIEFGKGWIMYRCAIILERALLIMFIRVKLCQIKILKYNSARTTTNLTLTCSLSGRVKREKRERGIVKDRLRNKRLSNCAKEE